MFINPLTQHVEFNLTERDLYIATAFDPSQGPIFQKVAAELSKKNSAGSGGIFDIDGQFELIKKSALEGIKSVFPIEGKKQKLVLIEAWVDDNKMSNDYATQKKAKLKDGTFGVPVYATIAMIDIASGKEIDRKEKVKLTDLPKLTDRNTFIVGGSEWNIPTQFRLKPGVYTVKQANGLPKTQINLGAGGRGRALEIHLDPEKERVMLHVNSSTMPLYPILKAMGQSHEDISKAWGQELADKNAVQFGSAARQTTNVRKFANKYLDVDPKASRIEAVEKLKEHMAENTELSEETTRITLHEPHARLSPELLTSASGKLVKVQNGEADFDDRDHLRLKSVHSVDDIFKERFTANKRQLHARLRRAVDSKNKVRDALAVPYIKKMTEGMFSALNLSERSEQHNPVHILNEANKTTLMGEGALGNLQMVKDEARSVHPSHLGLLDPIKTPESAKIGVVNYMTVGAKKVGNELTGLYINPATGEKKRLTPGESHEMKIALPDQFDVKRGKVKFRDSSVKVQYQGKIEMVPAAEVDYVIPSAQAIFTYATAKAPFLNSMSGGRAFMASKHPEQALALVNPEVPMVQTHIGKGRSIETEVGKAFAAQTPISGKISKVEDDSIVITPSKGKSVRVPIYDMFKLNEKSFFNHKPVVKVGDRVKQGDLIADLNFTKNGELALGRNARVGYIVQSGKTLEDGFVVSQSYAKEMTHEQVAEETAPKGDSFIYDKRSFAVQFPGAISAANAAKLDSKGVIRKGQTIEPGEVIVALQRKQEDTSEDRIFRKLGRGLARPVKNFSLTWTKDVPGKVIEVAETAKGYKVQIKFQKELGVADKLAGTYGNKGVVSEVRPDHLMPKDSNGRPIDIAFNPLGVVGRINPSQIFETNLGAIAEKTGERQLIDNFKVDDNWSHVMQRMEDAGVTPTIELFDEKGRSMSKTVEVPIDNAWLAPLKGDQHGFKDGYILKKKDVDKLKKRGVKKVTIKKGTTVGRQYFHKLAKTAETGFSARAFGEGYDLNGQPVRGGEQGSKSMDQLTNWSMVAHGSRNLLREMSTQKSEQNDEFWRAVQMGHQTPAPKVPFAWRKMEDMLRVAGIDTQKNGSLLTLQPTKDDDLLAMSKGELTDVKMLRGKGLREHRGGLFDPDLTGGVKGKNWTHIELAEKIPNPIFKDPIKKLLDINDKTYDGLVNGEKYVGPDGKVSEGGHEAHASDPRFITGGPAIEKLLSNVDLGKTRARFTPKAKRGKGSERNSANRALRYISALESQKRRPEEAYMTKVVGVLPPAMRPVYKLPSGDLGVSPLNYLYRDIGMINNQMKENDWMDDDLKTDMRKSLYQGFEALVGMSGSRPLTRPVKGVISTIAGDNPKSGYFQDKLLRKQQDLAGRGVAVPNPNLDIDEVGIPKKMALQLFKPFIIEKLTKQFGLSMAEALKRLKDGKRDPLVQKALHAAMQERDVLINRAPSLHKYSIQSFKPKVVTGKAIETNTLIHAGFNLDHDGDALNVHVPVTPEAVQDARNMRPSAILRSPAKFGDGAVSNYLPMHMQQHGIYEMSKMDGRRTGKRFDNEADVMSALDSGEIQNNDVITFKGMQTSAGRVKLNSVVPAKFQRYDVTFNKKEVRKLVDEVSKENKQAAAHILSRWQKMGDATSVAETITMWDVRPVDTEKKKKAIGKAKRIARNTRLTRQERSNQILDIVEQDIVPEAMRFGMENKSSMFDWMESGATGKKGAIIQAISGPTMVTDHKGDPIPSPVENSFSEGLSVSDYFNTQYGARGGMIGRALSTAQPGYLNKLILSSVGDSLIAGNDCGDKEGIKLALHDPHAMNRFEVGTHKITTPSYVAELKKQGKKEIHVRSAVTCKNANGICKMCYGPNEDGVLHENGVNIGAIAGQSIGEPLTQAAMKSFHTGGAIWEKPEEKKFGHPSGFKRIQQLINMPQNIPDKAPLASVTGTVGEIKKNPAGGFTINIDGNMHRTPPGAPLKVKRGDTVKKGQPLSDGLIDPREVLQKKGLRSTQKFLTESLYDAYGNKSLSKKNFEVVVRGLTNTGVVTDPGENTHLNYGDTIPLSMAEDIKRNPVSEMYAEDAVGFKLEGAQHGLPHGHEIGPMDLIKLSGKKVKVLRPKIGFRVELYGVTQLPHTKKDWLSALGQERIQKTLTEGAATGAMSNIHGMSPTAAFAYGKEYGRGPDGRY